MQIHFFENFTATQVMEKVRLFDDDENINSIVVLSSDTDALRSENFHSLLQTLQTTIFGGIFPEVIFDGKNYVSGCIVAGFGFESRCVTIPNLSDSSTDLDALIESESEDLSEHFETAMVFVDGLSERIGDFVDALFFNLGDNVVYLGGGCGSLSFLPTPCVFSNKGVLRDAGTIAFTKQKISTGVAHGWTDISESLKVTSSARNVITELNYLPAFEVYKQVVDNHSEVEITEENFFDIAKSYPFGLHKLNAESIIRDPIHLQNNSLVCVGEVPEGSYLKVFHGNTESLLGGAKYAKERASENLDIQKPNMWVVDCVSRALYMNDRFSEELSILQPSGRQIGVLSIGEIACSDGLHLDFHNKTTLVGVFE